MKRNLYKSISLMCLGCLLVSNQIKAQNVPPVPPAPPSETEMDIPMPPLPPSISPEKMNELSEKISKSMETFNLKMQNLQLSMVDLNKKLKENFKDFDQNFNLEMPAIPIIPEIPVHPEIPAIAPNHFEYNLGKPENATEKVKRLSKTYAVDANDALSIDNSFGRITVNTWDKNEIKVDVEVRAFADDESDAQKLLDNVIIANNKTENQISFKTNIEKDDRGSWMSISWWRNGNERKKVDIYYTVYMPAKNAINLKTNYTTIILPDLKGSVVVNMNYGDLKAGKLTGNAKVSSNYGRGQFAAINNGNVNSNYGDFSAEDVSGLNANFNHCSAILGKLGGSNTVKMNYAGGFKVTSFDKDFKALNVSSNYSSLNFDLNGIDAFNFDVSISYASFKYDETRTKVTSKSPSDEAKGWNPNKNYKGYFGKSSTDANINIRSNYGSVRFN
ncbi:hypothetical protein N9R54_05270 [Pelobium sp.]|nr:hypothetical protein [Pelobium sp.]MDA9555629.1 hypothetical protein [Pelobium sp.]